jgi:hypothetical protein
LACGGNVATAAMRRKCGDFVAGTESSWAGDTERAPGRESLVALGDGWLWPRIRTRRTEALSQEVCLPASRVDAGQKVCD